MIKKKLFPFVILALSGLFIGASQYFDNANTNNQQNYSQVLADDEPESPSIACTKVIINDDCKWNFRDLNIGFFTFDTSKGYGLGDFKNFLDDYYGKNDSLGKEDITKGYKYNNNDGNPWFDITSGTGQDGHISTFYFPYWVKNFTIYVKNIKEERGFSELTALNVDGNPDNSRNGFGKTVTLTISGNDDASTKTFSVSSAHASTNTFGTKTINIKPYSAANTPISSLQEKTIVVPNYNHADFLYQSYIFNAAYRYANFTGAISNPDTTIAKLLPTTVYAKYTSDGFDTPDGYLFVKVPTNWNEGGGLVSVYFYTTENNNTYWTTTKEGHLFYWYNTNVFRVAKPTGSWTHIIIVRLNPDYLNDPGWHDDRNPKGRWAQTDGISLSSAGFSSYNTVEVTDLNNTSYNSTYVINSNTSWGRGSGDVVYLDLNSSWRSSNGTINNNFIELGNKMYAYLFDSNISPDYTLTLEFKQILGFDSSHKIGDYDYNMNLLEIVIPDDLICEDVQWHQMIIYQGQDPWTDEHKDKWRQTDNVLVHPLQNNPNNTFKITGFDENKLYGAYEWSVPYYGADNGNDRLNWFVNYFIDQTGTVCDALGDTDVDDLKMVWTTNEDNVSLQYLNMCDGCKDAFVSGLDTRSRTLSATQRYDLIIRKYYKEGIDDFAKRFTNEQLSSMMMINRINAPFLMNDDNVSSLIIIVASSISLLSITILSILVIRKKKRISK